MNAPAPPASLRAAVGPLLPLYALDVLTALTVGMVPPILPHLAASWKLSAVGAGLVNTIYAVGRLCGSYPASRLRARHGTRAAVFVGVALLCLGSVGCGLAPSFPLFLAARIVMGVGASAAFLAIFAEVLDAAPAAWRGRLANAFEGMSIVSLAVGGVLAAGLAEVAGWRGVFLGMGLVLVAGAGFWRPLAAQARPPGAAAATEGAPRTASRRAGLGAVYGAAFAMAVTWSGLFATLAPLLGHDAYGLDAGGLGLALGAGYVAEVLALAGVGLVIDRARREPVFVVGAVSTALGGAVLAAGAHPAVFVLGLALVGAGFAGWMIPATVLADRSGTPIPPGVLAVFRVTMDAGMILGPLVLAGVAELAGQRLAVGVSGLVLVAGALALARR